MARTIANVAVDLFEHNGVAATTVDDIAAAAGISRTTFFRHCAGKEAAALVDDAGFEAALVDAAATASRDRPRATLDQAWDGMVTAFDADAEGSQRFLRVRRLMQSSPSLNGAGLLRNAALLEHIAQALRDGAGLPELDARAVADRFCAALQLTFDEWVRRVDAKVQGTTLRAVRHDVEAALTRAER